MSTSASGQTVVTTTSTISTTVNTVVTAAAAASPSQITTKITSAQPQKMYAKALYDNVADTPDELTFKRGEILNVIEQDTDGLTGWWLCSLRGRQGICPGNRLRIMNSYDSGCFSLSPTSSPCQSLAASTATLNSSILSSDIYENTSMISISQQQLNQQNNATSTPLATSAYSRCSLPSSTYGQGNRRSWHVSPHKVITPQKCGDVYLYDLVPSPPPSATPSSCNSSQPFSLPNETSYDYDVPKPPTPVLNQSFSFEITKNPWCRSSLPQRNDMSTPPPSLVPRYSHMNSLPQLQEEAYDVPRPSPNLKILRQLQQSNLTPSSSNSSLQLSDSLGSSISSSNRSSFANTTDYDVPRRNPIPVKKPYPLPASASIRSLCPSPSPSSTSTSGLATYDFPSPNPKLVLGKQEIAPKELPLELQPAIETLEKLQSEAVTSISRLLSFVTPNWRSRERLDPILMEIKLAVVRLRTAIHDLAEFGEGALGNASKADDRNLAIKLRPLVKSLKDADKLVRDTSDQIESRGWTADNLSRSEQRNSSPPDNLDRLFACVQTLIEDVRLIASFIQGNAPLLFKRLSVGAGPGTPTSNGSHYSSNSVGSNSNTISSGSGEWVEDYDYVSFESKDATAKKNLELRDAIPENLHKNFDKVVKIAENAAMSGGEAKSSELNSNDKLLVKYYSAQIVTHMGYLNEAIDSFLKTVEKNQPPKFFIAYGKFVVLSAHNLVSIGDIVHRNISKADLKVEVEKCTDGLSDTLKDCVLKSKKAAQCFPSVTAVQEMVDSVVDISHLANDLKTLMLKVVSEEIIH